MVLRAPLLEKLLWRCRHTLLSRPSAPAGSDGGPIIVAGLFRTASGIGQSARACADGLEKAGVQVHRVDLSAAFGQLELPPDPRFLDRPPPGGTLILHFNAPEVERALFLLENWRGSARRVIGMWVWEMPITPEHWRPATRWLSEIWVPSRFSYDALRPLTDKPMKIVPYFIPAPSSAPQNVDSSRFTVIALGDGKSSFARKNLAAALSAFQEAQLDRDAQLILKTRHLDQSPIFQQQLEEARASDPRIRIIDGSLSHDEVLDLIASANVLISLHRAEGFGLTIAEAMLQGKPVIATGWSGNIDFMNEDSAIVVPYRLVPVDDSYGVYSAIQGAVWAEPDIAYAACALSELAANPCRRTALGNAARQRILPLTTGAMYTAALQIPDAQPTLDSPFATLVPPSIAWQPLE